MDLKEDEAAKADTQEQSKERGPRRPYPVDDLEKALKIASVIQSKNNGNPWKPMFVAEALKLSPDGNDFRDLTSSSLKYGLTKGSYAADFIELTPLGIKVTKPRNATEKTEGLQEAVMKIPLFNKIFNYYKDGVFPLKDDFFKNMLEREFQVPAKWTEDAIPIMEKNGRFVGIIREVAGKPRVVLGSTVIGEEPVSEEEEEIEEETFEEKPPIEEITTELVKQIFVAHGKNKTPLDQLKAILTEFRVPFQVAIDEPHMGRPISEKVAQLMRECSSGIFIFTSDEETTNAKGEKIWRPSENVVFELGAGTVLYGSKIVIFREEEVTFGSDFTAYGHITSEKDKLNAKALELMRELIALGLVKFAPT
jgi:hypothetical protein